MANGLLTPLQITAAYGLGDNTALAIPAAVISAYNSYNAIAVITQVNLAIYNVTHAAWANTTVKTNVQKIAGTSNECSPLGNAPPLPTTLVDYTATRYLPGFTGYVQTRANSYIGESEPPGTEDNSIFCQGFMAAVNYCDSINGLINSSVNAQTYLGPTFPGNDALITNNISNVNPDFGNFASDLSAQGQLTNLADIGLYGTPAGLLRQIANVAVIDGDTLTDVKTPLLAAGLSQTNIKSLIQRPAIMSDTEFDQLQRLAYQGMTQVTGAALDQILSLLDITTPNLTTMADLLNQQKIFPNSYATLNALTADGYVPIYKNGTVNSDLSPNAVAVSGCEELGKVMPPDQALASKSVQGALQQLTGITQTTLPELATVVGGISTLSGLPLIQDQTAVLDTTVTSYFQNAATGSGANGTITVSDVIGSVWGYNVTDPLTAATSAVAAIPSGGLATLLTIYTRMVDVTNSTYGNPTTGPVVIPAGPGAGTYADGNAAMTALINAANTEISNIAVSYSTQCAAANASFDTIANQLLAETDYQNRGGLSYGSYQANSQPSVTAFVSNLPRYGTQVEPYCEAYFLNQVADISTLGGQAVVGSMREGVNTSLLAAAGLDVDIKPNSVPSDPPAPAVTPVY